MRGSLVWTLVAAIIAPVAIAQPLDGTFVALERCEAFQSKNNRTNPGQISVEPQHSYRILAQNAAGGAFLLVRVPGAPVTEDRWVSADCGVRAAAAPSANGAAAPAAPAPAPAASDESTQHLLALSWQPTFCEFRPRSSECRRLQAGHLPEAEERLSLHGLWPQPESEAYCDVPDYLVGRDEDGRWQDLPEPDLDRSTLAALSQAMPGVASDLHRHEWIKHGTCHRAAGGADEYFEDALVLLDAINASAVGDYIAENADGEIVARDLRAAFDEAFGRGAGSRVQLHCSRGDTPLVEEITIALVGVITPDSNPGDLMRAARSVGPGCPRGYLDPSRG